jgi:hypothetical protein
LAVETAAVYLGQFATDVTCAAFLSRLKKEGLAGLDLAAGQTTDGVRHGEKRLVATLAPTLERLNAREKLALSYSALLPADQIALSWIRSLVAEEFTEVGRDAEAGYPDPWMSLLRRLLSLRLFQPAKTSISQSSHSLKLIRVHRLVQEVLLPAFDDLAVEFDWICRSQVPIDPLVQLLVAAKLTQFVQ